MKQQPNDLTFQQFSEQRANQYPAPVAKREAKILSIHGDERTDSYYWMKLSDAQKNAETPDAHTQEVLDYLNAENT